MRAEVGSLQNAVLSRAEIQPCVDARLSAVRTLIRRHDEGRALEVLGPVGRPVYFTPATGAWDMAVADQSLSRMPFAERNTYLSAYQRFGAYSRNVGDERSAWRALQLLNEATSLLPADWSRVREAYEQAGGNQHRDCRP